MSQLRIEKNRKLKAERKRAKRLQRRQAKAAGKARGELPPASVHIVRDVDAPGERGAAS